MPAPLIGITTNYVTVPNASAQIRLSETYIQSIQRAGGLPVLIPVGLSRAEWEDMATHLDGLLLTGGGDIETERFHGRPHPRVYEVDLQRDAMEIGLLEYAAGNKMPFLGICRGVQIINVALGGDLYTDIGDQLEGALRHDWYPDIPRDHLAHAVKVSPDSRLAQILGANEVKVNSLHHQGIDRVAPSLKATAYAPDGLVEAVELPQHPFGLGVQWHPECLPAALEMQALFRAFVSAAGRQ